MYWLFYRVQNYCTSGMLIVYYDAASIIDFV